MSKPTTSDNSSAVGLFPFLAVLLCTMGALLVLLLILAQRVGVGEVLVQETESPAQQAPIDQGADPAEVARLQAELARIETYRQKLAELEQMGKQRLKEEKSRLSHLEDHIRRMEHELAELALAVQQLEATEANQTIDQQQAKRELKRLKQLIKDTEVQLEDMREMAGGERSYAVVPYRGKNGTYAQPIYILCDENGITLEPEGLRFQPTDFVDPRWAGNPLAAALRASRDYLSKKARRAGQPEPLDPYPLILVRPAGIKYYRIAREAITSWDASFGYEFVDEDWKLTFPELPDPKLAEVQQHAVMIARDRLSRLVRSAPRRFRGVAGMSGGNGLGGNGQGSGFGDSAGDSGGDRYGSGLGTGEGSLAGGEGGDGYFGLAASDSSGSDAFGGGSGQDAHVSLGPYGGQPSGDGQGGSDDGQQAATGNGGSGSGGHTGEQGAAEGAPNGSGNGNDSAGQSFAGGPEGEGQEGPTGGTASSAQSFGQSGGQAGSSGGAASSGSASSQAASAAGAAGTAADNQDARQTTAGMPSLTFTKQQSIADARGSDWAVEQAMKNAVPIRRPIQVAVRQNQIALLPSRHASQGAAAIGTVISLDQPLEQISDQFVAALKTRFEEWGLAGNRLYWRPVLQLHVGPEAGQTANRLVRLLKNSGVDVEMPHTANSQRGQGANETR